MIKPSIIESDRLDFRPTELIAAVVMRTIASVLTPLQKFNPISAENLARSIVNIMQTDLAAGVSEYELDQLFEYINE